MRPYNRENNVRFVEANGLRHAYFEQGKGPLVLMLHGFPDTPHTWDAIRPAVAQAGFRVVTPFLRGYAPSGIPDSDTDVRTQGEDVLALITALGEDKAHVVGHDFGASAAYAAAALSQDKLTKLATVAIPHPGGVKPNAKLAWALRHFITLRMPGAARRFAKNDFATADKLTKRWGPTWHFGADEMEPVKNAFTAPGCLHAALGYYRALELPPPKWMFNKIRVPTMSFAGADDPGVTPAAYEQARAMFSGPYEVVTLAGGHFLHRESGPAFTDRLIGFLRDTL